ncbi:hypothetical protein E4U03_05815 [Rothia nasimurium]|uniref:Uncharacterized protein n=1 Tax=Rothia nasimurium TaxID=85336 RepID=A0A4Y9F3P1_9MICC|nr:hypothetical protein [Rothia nasimurium]MBF0808123.1 hypothetical protein [Rothia nasimurium]TFU22551.1 hypothetical protein E4U03_05815 [Rothia nasimurium]
MAATKENPDLRVLIHIDRDNSLSRDIDKMNSKAEKLGYTLFVTDFYELENYFTTFDHLKHVLTGKSITNAKIKDIIRRSLDSAREDSFDKLFNQKSNDHEFMKLAGDPASAYRKCEELYNENELQYVKGKTLLSAISKALESEHGIRKSELLKWSPSLENNTLKNYINEN